MVCSGIEVFGSNLGLVELLAYPTTCDFQFWGKLMAAIFVIISLTLYFIDRERQTKSDLISAMGVASIATIILTAAGTLAGFIENIIMIEIFVGGLIFIAIWLFKK